MEFASRGAILEQLPGHTSRDPAILMRHRFSGSAGPAWKHQGVIERREVRVLHVQVGDMRLCEFPRMDLNAAAAGAPHEI